MASKRDAALVTELEPNPDILAWLGGDKPPGQELALRAPGPLQEPEP